MAQVSVKLSSELDRRLSELATRRRTTKAALVREALEALAAEPTPSVAALARDLQGCVQGPRDLSTGERHLEGYGR